MIYPTKKLGEILIGIIFVVFAFFLFIKEIYAWGTVLTLALLLLLKLDLLTEIVVNSTDGLRAKFIIPNTESKIISEDKKELTKNVAIVSYKIASNLPGTIKFNFLNDWRVWFWIANHDPKKYRAYVKVKFITNELEIENKDGYYGNTKAWKLNALSGIQAPGLVIPEDIKDAVKKGETVKIQINCDIKDENDDLIEKRFPQIYVYDRQNNSWFLEP